MNSLTQDNINLGLAISPQHSEINQTDYDFSISIQEILHDPELTDEQKVLKILNSENRVMDSYLSYIGLNINSFITVVRNLVLEQNFTRALELIDSLTQISSLDFTNPLVLDKYIAVLEFIEMKILRFGLNWSRLVFYDKPTDSFYPSTKGIESYCNIISKLREKGIEPIITFSHFDTLGMDFTTPEFEKFFKYLLEFTLPQFIKAGVKKFIPFNESSVHAGAISTGFWGYDESQIQMSKLSSLAYIYNQFGDYKKHLAALLKLNNIFYKAAHQIDPEVEIILNMNVTQILFGTNDGFLRNRVAKPIGRGIEDIHLNQFLAMNDNNQRPAHFDQVSIHPYHIVNGAGFTTMGGLIQLTSDILFKRKLPDHRRVTKLSRGFEDSRLKDNEKVRRGTNGQILSPEINIELIIDICKRYGITEIIITETGLDSKGDTPEGIELKKWYYQNFLDSIPRLKQAGIKVSSALFWSMFGNYEITGQHGGGMESFDFGALGKPLTIRSFKERLLTLYNEDSSSDIDQLIKKVFLNGNIPIQFYSEMLHFFKGLKEEDKYSTDLVSFIDKFLQCGGNEEDLVASVIQFTLILELLIKDEFIPHRILQLLQRTFLQQERRILEMGLDYIDVGKFRKIFSSVLEEA